VNDPSAEHEAVRRAWNHNAAFWDARMGDGNDFFNVLVWPATERQLAPSAGEWILDIACGNGLTSRRLAQAGAHVVAFDFAETMITLARERSFAGQGDITYAVIDATDYDALIRLGEERFDAALCNMALFDMAEIAPLMQALSRLLRPHGRFVFSLLHPCFNNPFSVHLGELEDREGTFVTTYSVKISRYMTPQTRAGLAIAGQLVPHFYFHRPLADIFAAGFTAGFVLDGFEERAFPPDHPGGSLDLSWGGRYSDIPPALVARMRKRPELSR
jgi:2-polyprenyl-3-methyl-5-hydroxy-6-metoxy-1,4-benzoquinol methylase